MSPVAGRAAATPDGRARHTVVRARAGQRWAAGAVQAGVGAGG